MQLDTKYDKMISHNQNKHLIDPVLLWKLNVNFLSGKKTNFNVSLNILSEIIK